MLSCHLQLHVWHACAILWETHNFTTDSGWFGKAVIRCCQWPEISGEGPCVQNHECVPWTLYLEKVEAVQLSGSKQGHWYSNIQVQAVVLQSCWSQNKAGKYVLHNFGAISWLKQLWVGFKIQMKANLLMLSLSKVRLYNSFTNHRADSNLISSSPSPHCWNYQTPHALLCLHMLFHHLDYHGRKFTTGSLT